MTVDTIAKLKSAVYMAYNDCYKEKYKDKYDLFTEVVYSNSVTRFHRVLLSNFLEYAEHQHNTIYWVSDYPILDFMKQWDRYLETIDHFDMDIDEFCNVLSNMVIGSRERLEACYSAEGILLAFEDLCHNWDSIPHRYVCLACDVLNQVFGIYGIKGLLDQDIMVKIYNYCSQKQFIRVYAEE